MLQKIFAHLSQIKPWLAGLLAGLGVLITVAITGATLYWAADKAIRAEVQADLSRIAAVASSTIDVAAHTTFKSQDQENSKAYATAVEPLRKIQESSDQIAYIYTLIESNGKICFILDPTEQGDSDKDGVDDKSHIMQVYDDVTPAAIEALQKGKVVAETQPYSDEWGTFISGYAPFKDDSGKVVGVVGVDLEAGDFVARIAGVRKAGFTGLAIGFLLAGLVGVLAFLAHRSSQTNRNLAIQSQLTLAAVNQNLEDQNNELLNQRQLLERANKLTSTVNDQLRTVSVRFEQLFQKIPVACFTFDSSGKIMEWNPEFETLLGLEVHDLFEKSANDLLPQLAAAMASVFDGNHLQGFEWTFQKSGGEPITLSLVSNAFPIQIDDRCVGAIGAIIDITERQQLQAQLADKLNLAEDLNLKLEELSVTDGLTGTKNRRAFQEELAKQHAIAMRQKKPLSVILLDVDKFKLYNDTYGHQAGDWVLQQVAKVLTQEARISDFVARYGGEEFVIILPQTDTEEACQVAERMRLALESHTWTDRLVTASFGVSTLTDQTSNGDWLVKHADEALYAAKESGRNQVVRYDALSEDASAA